MDSSVRTASSVTDERNPYGRLAYWLLVEGDRRVVTAGFVAVGIAALGSLVAADVVTVGPGSSTGTLFGSGLTAGVVALVTIALSINQLILARVFGSPTGLVDRLQGARDLRARVEELADQPSSSIDPARFLSLLATTLEEQAKSTRSTVEQTDRDLPDAVVESLDEIAEYGRSIDEEIDAETAVANVLGVIIGSEYAINMTAVRHLQNGYGDALPADARAELQALGELLEFVAVVRQFFKTMALQQDFAALSRLLVYSGLVALLFSVLTTLVYRSGTTTLPESILEVLVPVAFGTAVTPFALFAAYLLRAATIAHQTVSVGPFVPPGR